jgi:TPR repeat protein
MCAKARGFGRIRRRQSGGCRGGRLGHVDAQFDLGEIYGKGEGVLEDSREAVRWYRMAAEQGLARAQYALGWMYGKGKGVQTDSAEAVRWCRMAAEQGYAAAQFNLGELCALGDGVPKDSAEAVRWYRMAAEQGLAIAQFNLGQMYKFGEGVAEDRAEAMGGTAWRCGLATRQPLAYGDRKGDSMSSALAADWFHRAGLSYLEHGEREAAFVCAQRMWDLGDGRNSGRAVELRNAIEAWGRS